jgi:hypothetical protein
LAPRSHRREIHDQLITAGRAEPHGAGFAGVVSYFTREEDDAAGGVELFRLSSDRAKSAGERRRREDGAGRSGGTNGGNRRAP